MNSKTLKRQRDLKNKLMAAISMLLVSSIMLVTSTYAWFTLSTAPEVTGITTAVGANGNLEMALLPTDGKTETIDANSGVGNSIDANGSNVKESNVTWGNLVDLSNDTIYGLNNITLLPSALNVNNGMLQAALLQIPNYGADGRVSELAASTLTGIYNDGKFTPDAGEVASYGVRAVGTASGMTERQLDYRNARSAANTARVQAAAAAAATLNTNGSALANIAIKYGMNTSSATFTVDDVNALKTIVNDLEKEGGILKLIEKAYMQYILAYAASANGGGTENDTAWMAVKTLVSTSGATLSSVQQGLTTANVTLPQDVSTMITSYDKMVSSVNTAKEKLNNLTTTSESTYTWGQIKDAMTPLVDPEKMEINGFKASEVKTNLGALVSSVTAQGGLKVIMKSGAGVFADIADHTEDYSASVNIERVEYQGIELNNMAARMETASTLKPNYNLVKLGAVVTNAGAPGSGATGTMPMTDFYGYVIDLAFRTNAAESQLLLQQDAVDRIYDNNANEDTMGHGATMTFKATTTDFTDEQVKALMSAIRIVFFDPGTSKVITYAKLDTENATFGTDGWTAKICLCEISDGGTTYKQTTYQADSGKTYYKKESVTKYNEVSGITADNFSSYTNLYTKDSVEETYTAVTSGVSYNEGTTYYVANETVEYKQYEQSELSGLTESSQVYVQETAAAGTEVVKSDNAIMPLTQNTAHKLSVLVYLDGNKVTNGSVAATAATSVTGSMNLQFASSAKLVPMDYTSLHTPGTSTGTGAAGAETPEVSEGTTGQNAVEPTE